MKLANWMDITNHTPESLAEELQVRGCRASADLVRKVLAGTKRFGLDSIHEIQKASKGKVSFDDLYVPLVNLRKASGE